MKHQPRVLPKSLTLLANIKINVDAILRLIFKIIQTMPATLKQHNLKLSFTPATPYSLPE